MFRPGSFRHLSIHFTPVGALWALGVLLVSISLLGILSRADAPAPFASPRHASEAQSGASPSAQSIASDVFVSPLATIETTPPLASQPDPTATPGPAVESLIEAAWPADGATNVSPQTPLVIQFRGEVNPRAIEQALWILPQTEGEFTWDDQFMQFAPKGGWARGVTYRISLTRGRSMLAPAWTFKVKSLVRATTPRQHGRLSWGDDVRITFAEPMDHASVEAAFSISPEMPGELRWEDTTLVFTPGDQWLPGTDYTVILDSSLKTAAGEQPLRAPYRLSFPTARQTGTLSFGYGPNVQIVNPDGRRAVQFEASGNLESMIVRLHMLTVEQFLDRYTSSFRGVGPVEDKHVEVSDLPLSREWRQAIDPAVDRYIARELTLPPDLSPGLYVLTLDHPAGLADELILVYTHHTLVLKQAEGHIAAWASALGGGPLADMRVRIYDRDATLVAEAQTDAQGLLVTQVPIDPQPLIVIGERDGEITASGLSNEWEQNSWNWWWQPAPKANRTRAYIYTDRPIYRPGQTVHVKVAARYDNDAVYSRIPLEWDVIVRLRDARDNVVAAQTLHVNEYGTLNTSFELAEGGTVGTYHVEAQIKDEVQRQAIKVEEYRKPEYEVTVHTDRGNLVQGEPVSVTVEARTYFGAPLANARIELVTYQRQEEWWWYSGEQDASGMWSPLEGKSSGTTDANGRWTLFLTPQVRDYQYDDYRHSVTALIEASVQDDNGSSVSAHAQVIVHDAKFGLNVALPRHAYKPDQDIPVTVFARDIDGLPRADEPIVAEILGWGGNGQYNRALTHAEGRTDQDGGVVLNLKVAEQGWYQLRVSGRNDRGREVTRTDWVWVYDPASSSPWYAGEGSELQISADKSSYAPGDTAQLLIRTPISGTALLTFERGRMRRAQVVELTAPTTIVPVTIQDDDAPNIHVAVNVYRLTSNNDDPTWQSIPDANLLVAETNLSVPADNRRLTISLTPDRSTYGLREEAIFNIQVTGADGLPAQAELSFALVDEAIYALSEDLAADPFEAFYAERTNIVRTYDSLRPVRDLGGGMGGGGGGGDLLGNPRRNFPDTAYWNPTIVTGADGHAVVKVQLPDSLTRWRAVVRAVTADESPRVGEATASITTTQPIVIRPALPRQLVQGDQLLLSAIVHNNTGAARQAQVWIEAAGLTLDAAQVTQTTTLAADGSAVVGWPATAAAMGNVTVTLQVQSGDAADAVQIALPVAPLAAPDVESIVGVVEPSTQSAPETIVQLPPDAIVEATSLDIDLSPSIAASVLDGLAYLTGYPFGCVEQTMSKALPNAVVGRAFATLGVDNPALSADLPRKVSASLQRLYGYQHNDGGWGWWFDDSTDDYQTAYVLFGLAMTQQAGYLVDDGVIERGAAYLKERLPSINDKRTQAYALFALAMAGHGELAATQQLADDSAPLDVFSRAGLAIALQELGDGPRAQRLIDALASEAIVSNGEAYWDTGNEDGHYQQKTMSSSTRSTALALDALARIRPDDPLISKVVHWLMARRTADGWGTTQETAYAIVALTDYLRSTNELVAGSTYRVFVNDALAGEGSLSAGQMQVTLVVPGVQLRAGENRVRIERSSGSGRLYYKVTRRAMIAGAAEHAAGSIAITREYLDPKTGKPIESVGLGDLVRVKLNVSLPDESWYVAIEDPLPGGLEGLNERLNTTSFAARPDYYGHGYDGSDEFFYRQYGYNNKEVRDDRVVFFVTRLDKGQHTFMYLARATQAGTFDALPTQVYLMYSPDKWGRSASSEVSVRPSAAQERAVEPVSRTDLTQLDQP